MVSSLQVTESCPTTNVLKCQFRTQTKLSLKRTNSSNYRVAFFFCTSKRSGLPSPYIPTWHLIDLTEQYGSTSLPMTPHYVGLGLYKWTWTRSNTLPIALGPATLLKTPDLIFLLGILPSTRTERENHFNERSAGSSHYQLEFALNSSPEIQSLMNRERAFCGCLVGPPRARVQKDVL